MNIDIQHGTANRYIATYMDLLVVDSKYNNYVLGWCCYNL